MKSKRIAAPIGIMALAALSAPLMRGQESPYVKRGEPQVVAGAWEERDECSLPARDGGRLVWRADAGSILVKAGAKDRVECSVRLRTFTSDEKKARRYLRSFELTARPLEGGGVYVTGRLGETGRDGRGPSVEFQFNVPLRYNLDLETNGGDLEVERLEGELRGVTAGGDIRAGDVTGPVRVETAGGSVTLGNVAQRAEARTAGGNIRAGNVKGEAIFETSGGEIVAGMIEGPVRAETAGGDILLRGASGAVVAETAGGQIQVGEVAGTVRARTAGGSIRLHGARGRVEAETAGGSIDLYQCQGGVRLATAAGHIVAQFSTGEPFTASRIENAAGDIKIYLPLDLALNIDAMIDQAAGHKIITDFPLVIQGDREGFPVTTVRAHGALHGGGEILRIRTVMGNIEIRKLDSTTKELIKEREKAFWKGWEARADVPGRKRE